MKDNRTLIYYDDEQNDEFSLAQITPRKIDEHYVYISTSPFEKLTHFFWYRIVATPIAFLYMKLKFRHKIVGRKLLQGKRGQAYFLYGNHTQPTGDAFAPSLFTYPKHAYVIVHPNNVSMPILGKITPSLGALPLPDNLGAKRNFNHALETRVKEGRAIVIYPEAHIWPYYTGIRPFPDTSFSYPIKFGTPVYCFTNTYQTKSKSKKIQLVTYIDGPFYPDPSLSRARQRKDLRDRVYATMVERSKNSNVNVITYVRRPPQDV